MLLRSTNHAPESVAAVFVSVSVPAQAKKPQPPSKETVYGPVSTKGTRKSRQKEARKYRLTSKQREKEDRLKKTRILLSLNAHGFSVPETKKPIAEDIIAGLTQLYRTVYAREGDY